MNPARVVAVRPHSSLWTVLWAVWVAGWCLVGVNPADAQTKIGVLDMAKVFTGYYKFNDGVAKLSEGREAGKKELEARIELHHRLIEELATIDKEIARAGGNVAAATKLQQQRTTKAEEARNLVNEVSDQKASRERAFEEQLTRVRTQLVEEIMVVVNAIVARDHYDLILNKSDHILIAGKPLVLYSDASMDITDEVLATLNKSRPSAHANFAAPTLSATPDPLVDSHAF